MPDPGDHPRFTTNSSVSAAGAAPTDPTQSLTNLSAVNSRMDSLQRFLSDSISNNVLLQTHHMDMVSTELSSAIQQVILNASSLLAFSQIPNPPSPNPNYQPPNPAALQNHQSDVKMEPDPDDEVIELDAVEILAEHVHFCDICGKGFKRDANLRMHMRAHGDHFKRPEALAKPTSLEPSKASTKFSCPFAGCNRNQRHNKFKPLKSVICVRNHFKRSHCPKMYSCNRCHNKNFSVMSDLKSHLKNCGESRWRCSCGTTFSRKDKLFGHMALFDGHMPAIRQQVPPQVTVETATEAHDFLDDDDDDDGMFDDFGGIDKGCFQEMFGSSASPDFAHQFYNI